MRKITVGWLVFLIAVFILLRLPALHLAYHQDEAKWVTHATTIGDSDTGKGHPPLSGMVFPVLGKVLGADNMRAIPLFFGLLNFFLLYYLARKLFGKAIACWSLGLFSLVFYSVLASLMIDMDGQFLPFFVLLMFNTFFGWYQTENPRHKLYWGLALLASILLGFMVKLSFIIPTATLVIFYLSEKRILSGSRKNIIRLFWASALSILVILISFISAKYLLPGFSLERVVEHAFDHFNFGGRELGQMLFQTGKALLYSSPLLILPLLLINRQEIKQTKVFFLFLGLGLVFYYLLFDFSRAALDKYLAFTIIPLCLIGGVILKNNLEILGTVNKKIVLIGGGLVAIVFFLQFIHQLVPALYPKGEWLNRVFSFDWNFLMPFTGGSGPLGFYVSFLFMALLWITAISAVILTIFRSTHRKSYLLVFLLAGLVYNLTFTEEYILGRINGNATDVLNRAVIFIAENPQIDSVITYNDIGGYELAQIGKYERRIYAAPKNDVEHKQTLNNFKKYYLVVDIPRLSPDSIYAKYFSTCQSIHLNQSHQISATVYDCQGAMDVK